MTDETERQSLFVTGGLLAGLFLVATTGVSAQMQPAEQPSVEVSLEAMLLVGVVAAVGAFVGASLANWYWNRQTAGGRQSPTGRQQPPQQRQPAHTQSPQTGHPEHERHSPNRQPDGDQRRET